MGPKGHVSETGGRPTVGLSRAPRSGQKQQRPGGQTGCSRFTLVCPPFKFAPFILCVSHQSLKLVVLCCKKYRGGQQAKAAKTERGTGPSPSTLLPSPAWCQEAFTGGSHLGPPVPGVSPSPSWPTAAHLYWDVHMYTNQSSQSLDKSANEPTRRKTETRTLIC